jgi:hypothetical protein
MSDACTSHGTVPAEGAGAVVKFLDSTWRADELGLSPLRWENSGRVPCMHAMHGTITDFVFHHHHHQLLVITQYGRYSLNSPAFHSFIRQPLEQDFHPKQRRARATFV